MSTINIDRLLLHAVDVGLAASIILVPAAMGGRIAMGHLLLVALAVWTAACWCLRQCLLERATWFRSAADWLLPAALAFVALQTIPLPPALLETLSPHIYKVLPLWSPHSPASGSIGVWNTLSLDPAASRAGFVLLTAFALLFLTAVQRLQTVADVERMLRLIAFATIGMAALAMLQYLAGNGKYFWFYQYHFIDTQEAAVGSFANRNHFAQFIALGIGPVIWWSLGGSRSDGRRPSRGVGFLFILPAIVVFAGLMSLSRGGAFCILLACMAFALVAWRNSPLGRKAIVVLAGSAMLSAALFCTHGFERLATRFDNLATTNNRGRGVGRLSLWCDDARAVADYPLTGSGLGSHREVCPIYHATDPARQHLEYTHAENGYVQVAMEGGLIGLSLALAAVGLCVYWCIGTLYRRPSSRIRFCLAAVAPGLAANFAHSCVDFVWYVPGCMVLTVVLAAMACRLHRMAEPQQQPATQAASARIRWAMLSAVLLLMGCLMVRGQLAAACGEYHWNRFLALARGSEPLDEAQRLEAAKAKLSELEAVLRNQPYHARAQCRLAGLHLSLFGGSRDQAAGALTARQVRDAAVASRFESPQALWDWLYRAFGDRVEHLQAAWGHSQRALSSCPLRAEAYLYLAELCFMKQSHSPDKDSLIEQALRVRPHDAAIAYEAGDEALLDGDLQKACGHWHNAFHFSNDYQIKLIERLHGRVDASFFLETFQPDAAALARLAGYYRRAGRMEDYRLLTARSAEARVRLAGTTSGRSAAENWMRAAAAYRRLKNPEKQLACLRQAVRYDMSNYDARYRLAVCCYKQADYEAAGKHFQWCLRERPYDKELRSLNEAALNKRLRLGSRRDGADRGVYKQ